MLKWNTSIGAMNLITRIFELPHLAFFWGLSCIGANANDWNKLLTFVLERSVRLYTSIEIYRNYQSTPTDCKCKYKYRRQALPPLHNMRRSRQRKMIEMLHHFELTSLGKCRARKVYQFLVGWLDYNTTHCTVHAYWITCEMVHITHHLEKLSIKTK